MLVYVKINVEENKDDRDYKKEFLRTVVDVEKLSKGGQLNFLVAGYMENVKKFLDFEIRFPFQPVGVYKFIYFFGKFHTLQAFFLKGNLQSHQLYF